MDLIEDLVIPQCCFCAKYAEECALTEVNSKSKLISSENIEFSSIVFDVVQRKMTNELNSICQDCSDLIIQFYMFKRNFTRNNENLVNDKKKLVILKHLDTFLDKAGSDLKLMTKSNCFALFPEAERSLMESFATWQNPAPVVTPENRPPKRKLPAAVVKESSVLPKNELPSDKDETAIDDEKYLDLKLELNEQESENLELIDDEEEEEVEKRESPRRKKSKKESTKEVPIIPKVVDESTTIEDRQFWIKNQLKSSKQLTGTPDGLKFSWLCAFCNNMFYSDSNFRYHLNKYHPDIWMEDQSLTNRKKRSSINEESGGTEQWKQAKLTKEQKLWYRNEVKNRKELIYKRRGSYYQWSCSKCTYVCNKECTFRYHLHRNHVADINIDDIPGSIRHEPPKFPCYDCGLMFKDNKHFMAHKKCHQLYDTITPHINLPKCEECRYMFSNEVDLNTHVMNHLMQEVDNTPIPAVGIVVKACQTFQAPKLDKNIDPTVAWNCGHCLEQFSDELNCRKHQLFFHAVSFICPFDNRTFTGQPTAAFNQHLANNHPELFPNLTICCTYCKTTYATVYEKLAHMKVCKEKKYCCDHCSKCFFRKSDLIPHLKLHVGLLAFSCEICGKKTKDNNDLKIHMRSHTSETPYKCSLCPKAYKTVSGRSSHMETHKESSHECSLCEKTFKRRDIFKRHMRMVHDEKYRGERLAENTCTLCDTAFLKKFHFINHMKVNHNVIIPAGAASSLNQSNS